MKLSLLRSKMVILFFALLLFTAAAAQAREIPNTLGASEACEDCVLGEVNGCPACLKEGKLHICENNFPDSMFPSHIHEFIDTNHDGVLSAGELAVESIEVKSKNVESLAGIEFFAGLAELDCSNNDLTALDLTANKALKELKCLNNDLTNLNVSACSALMTLECSHNQLKKLNVSGLTGLTSLKCSNNKLETLNAAGCSALEVLSCSGNKLTALSLTGCAALKVLLSYSNQLTQINVNDCAVLETLECGNNKLTALDVSHSPALRSLNCYANSLSALNIAGNTALEYLNCSRNGLTSLDLSRHLSLITLACQDNALASLNLSKNTQLVSVNCAGNPIGTLDISAQTGIDPDMLSEGSPTYGTDYLDTAKVLEYRDPHTGLLYLAIDNDILLVRKTETGYEGGTAGFTCHFQDPIPFINDHVASTRWQESSDGGATWKNVASSVPGYNTPSIELPIEGSRNGYYRCVATYESGKTRTSAGVFVLTVLPRITVQPKAVSGTVGATVKFTVGATGAGLKYRWQYKYPDGSWTNSGFTSAKTAALSFTAQAKYNKMQYRCRITDANGKTLTSSAVTLTITPKITVQPKSTSATVGAAAKFNVTASGAGLKYQWQYKYPDGSWTNSGYASGKTAALSFTAQAKYNKMQYRCKITDVNGKTVTSSAVTLTISPKITVQPESTSAAVGAAARFGITATGAGLKYQWQYKYPNGSWTNSSYTSAQTAVLRFGAQARYNKMQYRCIITDANGKKLTSSVVTLTITPKITAQPKSITASVGATAKFTVTATGAGLKYQWQYKYPDGSWTNSGYSSAKTATLSVPVLAKYNGIQYRCIITDANGKKLTSSTATLTVR